MSASEARRTGKSDVMYLRKKSMAGEIVSKAEADGTAVEKTELPVESCVVM